MRPRPVCSHLVPASPIYHEPLYGFISFLFIELPVPAFVEIGDKIEIDTRTDEYRARVK